ncbi:hypothetical protein DPMN_071472, partial [Dreissena polymorpha]
MRARTEAQILTEVENGHYKIVDEKPLIISALGAIPKSDSSKFRSRPFDVPLPRMKDHKLCPVKAIFHAAQSTRQADANGPAFYSMQHGEIIADANDDDVHLKIIIEKSLRTPLESLYGLTRFAQSEDEYIKAVLFRKLSFQSEHSISIMPPRQRRTKAPRAAKDAQVEEQPESPCLPLHDQEEPTAP